MACKWEEIRMGSRFLLLLGVCAAMLLVVFGVSPTHESNAQTVNGCAAVFDYSGKAQSFVVPTGITQVNLNVFGAAGGDATGSAQNVSQGGFGAGVQNAVLPVKAGDKLTVIVGGEGGPAESLQGTNPGGTGGFGYDGNDTGGQSGGTGGTAQDYHGGGGGGGASAVLLNGTLVIAAGGGGGGSHGGAGGDGGTVGGNGQKASSGTGDPAAFGLGATQTAGGAGGVGSLGGQNGQAGVAGRGGDGGEAVGTSGGQSSPGGDAGGGGGGGTFGGGGAGGSAASSPGGGAGGGGGSSVTTIGTIDDGVRDGNGEVDIGLKNSECPGDLQIKKSVSDAMPKIGERITYTLKVTNNGPADDTDVVVTDPLPGQVQYVSDNCNGKNEPPWTWAVGSLANGASKTCKITVQVTDSGTDIPNTASVTGRNPDRKPDNNHSTATITVPPRKYDLEIVKDVAPKQVLVGDQVSYTLTVTNLGPEQSEPGGVADLLPPQVAYVSDTCGGSLHNVNPPPLTLPSGGAVDLPAGTYWVKKIPVLRPLDAVTCQIAVRVLQPGTSITNYGAVISHGTEAGLKLKNNLDDATIRADASVPPGTPTADLTIKKTAPATVGEGARFTWTMTVTNNGPDRSTGSTVTDQIPAAVVHPTTPTHGCTIAKRKLSCQVGALGAGQSTRIILTGRAPLRTGCVTNSAGVSGNELDPHATNNTALVRTCARAPRLRLTKSTSTTVVAPGGAIFYRIVVRNFGKGSALLVRVCDRPSADLEITRAPAATQVSSRGACWVIARLAAGNKRTLTVIAQVTAGARPGIKRNTATATASNAKQIKRSTARVRVKPVAVTG
jgi:uncharacterized repeat protein (TIGR01451 family)